MNDERLRKVVNKSGFPLQIAIQSQIKASNKHEWRVLFEEHFWKDNRSNQSGFIDLILDKDPSDTLIVECKRAKATEWIFLCDKESQSDHEATVKIWETFCEDGKMSHFGWKEVSIPLIPRSLESMYCVVSKKGNSLPTMLENFSADLLLATENFAKEDTVLFNSFPRYLRRYVSVIVTTAKLKLCEYDTSEISISSGEFDNAVFTELPYIRFRKQFLENNKTALDWNSSDSIEISKAKENSVFIVNIDSFEEFLTNFRIIDPK